MEICSQLQLLEFYTEQFLHLIFKKMHLKKCTPARMTLCQPDTQCNFIADMLSLNILTQD